MKLSTIAMLCHSINAAYCLSQGDDSQPTWDDAPDWQKQSAFMGVEMHINNPDATPEQSHESWLSQKEAEGWKYGEVKDAELKEHPCFRPYDELPAEQKAKDYLFKAMVHLVKDLPEPEEHLALVNQTAQLQASLAAFKQLAGNQAQSLNTAPAAKTIASGVRVKYVGLKDEYTDRLYESNLVFSYGQTRSVTTDLANKLLQHPEFVRDDALEALTASSDQAVDDTEATLKKSQEEKENKDKENTQMLDEIDMVRRMEDKDSLYEYAMKNFNQKIPKNQSVDWMKDKVLNLLDTMGVPQ
ncbi:hypothetical protein F994_02778 [Acinetobacter bohemicus ANC 3994]|uniref:Ryanodine receptor Ryr domain-containing protein n=1 Tax=Acinetobacter bohemicus ANC 3994 TaxID=1217715 RepID=N8NWA2_9GAMM|nr:RyR domain-containing protein [Acinetobacter bohemicus]ENU18651.1 hypothetical protein F994_02778 [Acinetobacter bohemicus ANC 3994]